jgi:hypothetical protein
MILPSGRVLHGIGVSLFLFGLAITPAWHLVAWIGGPDVATVEFPLGDVEDVAVDSQGRIYVGTGFLAHRVQRYSPGGEFECGWPVPTSGAFAMRTTPDGWVLVATARGKKLLTYSGDGELQFEATYDWRKENLLGEFASETETTGPYAVRRGLTPHVVDARTGRTVLATPWYKRLVAGPFPAMLYAAVGFALGLLGDLRRRREQPAPNQPPQQTEAVTVV